MEWYSADLQFVELRQDAGPAEVSFARSTLMFQATSWMDAQMRAIELGRSREMIYREENGRYARRAFVKLETLDRIGPYIEGREVHRESLGIKTPISFDEVFHPEMDEPRRTLSDKG